MQKGASLATTSSRKSFEVETRHGKNMKTLTCEPMRFLEFLLLVWVAFATYSHFQGSGTPCECSHGVPSESHCGCKECHQGYDLPLQNHANDKVQCLLNKCECEFGEPEMGQGCPKSGHSRCRSCSQGYVMAATVECVSVGVKEHVWPPRHIKRPKKPKHVPVSDTSHPRQDALPINPKEDVISDVGSDELGALPQEFIDSDKLAPLPHELIDSASSEIRDKFNQNITGLLKRIEETIKKRQIYLKQIREIHDKYAPEMKDANLENFGNILGKINVEGTKERYDQAVEIMGKFAIVVHDDTEYVKQLSTHLNFMAANPSAETSGSMLPG